MGLLAEVRPGHAGLLLNWAAILSAVVVILFNLRWKSARAWWFVGVMTVVGLSGWLWFTYGPPIEPLHRDLESALSITVLLATGVVLWRTWKARSPTDRSGRQG